MKGNGYGRLLLLSVGMALYLLALSFCQEAEGKIGLTQVVLEEPLGRADADRIGELEAEEKDPIGFCFWGETGEETVFCLVNGAQARGRVTLIAGHPALMEAEDLSWQAGCLMDEATARSLFGTARCGAQRVTFGGREYPVLGIRSGSLPEIVRLAEQEDGSVLNRCVLSLPPEEGKAQGESFLLRHGLEGKILNNYPLWAMTKNLLLLFPGLLMLAAWSRLGRGWRDLTLSGVRTGKQRGLLMRVLLSACLTAGTIWLLGSKTTIPPDMIPSRWSDFSFWKSWRQAQRENLTLLFSTAPGREQLQIMGNMVKSMIASTAAVLLALGAIRGWNHANSAD